MHRLTVANLSESVKALSLREAACAEDRQRQRHTSGQGPNAGPTREKDFELMGKLQLWIASTFVKMPQPACMSGLLAHRRAIVKRSAGKKLTH